MAGGVGLMAGAQPWVSFMLDGTHELVPVTGHEVNPALSPVAIALVAAALALTIAGPVFRRVLGGLVVLLGAGLVALTAGVIANPLAAVTGKITELTGITGGAATNAVVWSQLSTWAWVSVFAGVAAAVIGLLVVVFGGRWVTGGRKYDTGGAASKRADGGTDRISDWDALSDGDDPTAEIR
ncbi:Tryptophan-associated membrane protein [Leucobacter sp. 7(1)]|nr:Tryptophan-associated membrane protein [Leucobacter sp. 7(1)]